MYLCHEKDKLMARILLTIPFALTLIVAAPAVSRANASVEIIDNEMQDISISVKASTLHVTGADGQMLNIYNVAGVRVMSVRVNGQDCRYELNLPKGCYIVQVGDKTTRKISIK